MTESNLDFDEDNYSLGSVVRESEEILEPDSNFKDNRQRKFEPGSVESDRNIFAVSKNDKEVLNKV